MFVSACAMLGGRFAVFVVSGGLSCVSRMFVQPLGFFLFVASWLDRKRENKLWNSLWYE